MNINISVNQLHHSDIVGDVRDALAESKLDPRSLTLEITETVMMTNADLSEERLAELKELGVSIALDDFGTGYSSLGYLARFPVDVIKMDRSFLSSGASPVNSGLATAVIGLGKTFELSVVAEGIEFQEQWSALRALGCELGQGFYFAKPMDSSSTVEYLQGARTRSNRRGCCSPTVRIRAMQHSYEALDPAGGYSRVRLFAPLKHRDFRLLWTGMSVSLLGDGIFFVALAWQVYALSNVPTALSVVGIAMTVPTIAFLLLGGVISDRFDRRRVMLAADVLRGIAVGTIAVAVAGGRAAAVARRGAGAHLQRRHRLLQSGVRRDRPRAAPDREPRPGELARPVHPAGRHAARRPGARRAGDRAARSGGGVCARRRVVRRFRRRAAGDDGTRAGRRRGAQFGRGGDAGRVRVRPSPRVAVGDARQRGRSPTSCSWARPRCSCRSWSRTSCTPAPPASGLVFAAGGFGSVACAIGLAQRGLPRREITWMYVFWTVATFAVAGYGIAHALWGLMLASLAFNALETAGTIIWATAKQRRVPTSLLGRVSSLDWLISIGLLPLSFALTGPVSAAIGARSTLIAAGCIGGIVTFAALFVPGVRESDKFGTAGAP